VETSDGSGKSGDEYNGGPNPTRSDKAGNERVQSGARRLRPIVKQNKHILKV